MEEQWAKLQPERLRVNLVRAGLFLAGWEMLKGEVQMQVRGFFLVGFDENGFTYSNDYTTRVLSRHKSAFEASLLWLVEAEALTEAQAGQVRRLRDYRNEVAHELPKLLLESAHDLDVERIREMRELLAVLGLFWGRITVDTDPDFDGQQIADDDIRSMVSVFMDHLVDVADTFGDTPTSP